MFNYFRRAGLLMGRIFRLWEDPLVRVGGGILDAEQSGRAPLDGMVWECRPAPLFFLKPLPDSILGTETPVWQKLGGAGDPFGDHQCGNIVNCVFLKPWEPHTKVEHAGMENGAGVPRGVGASCERQPPSMVDEPVIHTWHRIKPVYSSDKDKSCKWWCYFINKNMLFCFSEEVCTTWHTSDSVTSLIPGEVFYFASVETVVLIVEVCDKNIYIWGKLTRHFIWVAFIVFMSLLEWKLKPLPKKKQIAHWAKNRSQLSACRWLSLCTGSAARPQQNTTSNRPFPLLISSFPDRSARARGVKKDAGKWFLAAEELSPERTSENEPLAVCCRL